MTGVYLEHVIKPGTIQALSIEWMFCGKRLGLSKRLKTEMNPDI